MGLILGDASAGEAPIVLTDILGSEDALGDMDFKIAGDGEGLTAFQMDIKVEGITLPVMRTASSPRRSVWCTSWARWQRTHPRAPDVGVRASVRRDAWPKYIGKIIGKGGEQIKAICEETGIDGIDINDEGQCTLTGSHGCDMDRAEEIIAALTVEPVIGKTYRGAKVVKVLEFGAFVEILPGVEGLCHVSELDVTRVNNPKDVVNEGDAIDVKLLETNEPGQSS